MAREAPTTGRYLRPIDPRYRPRATLGSWFRGGDWSNRTVMVVFLLGLVIGGVAMSASDLRPELEGVRKDLEGWQAFAVAQRDQIDELKSDNADLAAKLAARRPLPDFAGRAQADVEALAEELGWELEVTEQASGKGVGTVIGQSPEPGTLMELGARVAIVVAKPRS
jgi:hypothetical protein